MKPHLISLHTLRDLEDYLAIVYFGLSAAAWRYTATGRAILMSNTMFHLITAFGVFVISVYLATLTTYIIYPSYFDHLQPTVASIGWLGMHGHSLYPDWMTEDVYGMLYGPVLYLINGLVLVIEPTLRASKLPGVLFLIAAFCLALIAIKKRADNTLTSYIFLLLLVILSARFGPYAYGNRDPSLLFISALALLVSFELPSLVAGAIIGVLAGLAAGVKIHGFIYIFPTAIAAFVRAETQRERIAFAIVSVACAIIAALLPFVFDKEELLLGYLRYLTLAAHHGLSPLLIMENIGFAPHESPHFR